MIHFATLIIILDLDGGVFSLQKAVFFIEGEPLIFQKDKKNELEIIKIFSKKMQNTIDNFIEFNYNLDNRNKKKDKRNWESFYPKMCFQSFKGTLKTMVFSSKF